MIAFILGVMFGVAIALLSRKADAVLAGIAESDVAAARYSGPFIDERLARCKQCFGQIANRESLREVRKIAQAAIKELS